MSYGPNGLPDTIIHGGFPLPLRWQGWETTTHRLKADGWEILAHEQRDVVQDGIRLTIAATTPNTDMMLSGNIIIPYHALYGARYSGQNLGMPTLNYLAMAGINMGVYRAKDTYREGLCMKTVSLHKKSCLMDFDAVSTRIVVYSPYHTSTGK